jgi:hypothetical protein
VKLCKCLGLVVVSEELLRTAGPGTAALLRDSLVAGLARFLDQQFTDPTVAGGTTSPASITNGVTAVPSTGVLDVDVFALVAKFFEDRPLAERPTLLLPPAVSAALGVVDHAGDMRVRPMTLGQLPGLDTVVSANLGRLVVMLDAAAIAWTGADTIEFSYSRQASVEVSDTPTSPPIATTVLRNLWQENLAGLRTEQYVGWARSQVSAVQYLDTTPAAP